jgi:hypothetical protein
MTIGDETTVGATLVVARYQATGERLLQRIIEYLRQAQTTLC